MSGGAKQRIEVQDSTGTVLGYVRRHIRTGLWRATGNTLPAVNISGLLVRPSVRGRGAAAELVVRLPEGAAKPKDLEVQKEHAS